MHTIRPTGRLTAYAVFLALTIPFGIAVHLIAELAGLGTHDDGDLIFSSRHYYLAALAGVAVASLFGLFGSLPREGRHRLATQLIARLPFDGRGLRFLLFSFCTQFGFFCVTVFGEGNPLQGDHLGIGIIAALIASTAGACVLSAFKKKMLRCIIAFFTFIEAYAEDASAASARYGLRRRTHVRYRRAFGHIFSSRPPPYAFVSLPQ